MDIQSFAFGMLAALGLLAIVAIVVGLFKVYKHGNRLDSIEENMNQVERSINDRIDKVESDIDQRVSGIETRLEVILDTLLKRIEIGENETLSKVNRTIDRNENLLSNKIAELKTRVHELAIYQDLEHHKLQDLQSNAVHQINS